MIYKLQDNNYKIRTEIERKLIQEFKDKEVEEIFKLIYKLVENELKQEELCNE